MVLLRNMRLAKVGWLEKIGGYFSFSVIKAFRPLQVGVGVNAVDRTASRPLLPTPLNNFFSFT